MQNATVTNILSAQDEIAAIRSEADARIRAIRKQSNAQNPNAYVNFNKDNAPFSWNNVRYLPRPVGDLSILSLGQVPDAFFNNPDLSDEVKAAMLNIRRDRGVPKALDGALIHTAREAKGCDLDQSEKVSLRESLFQMIDFLNGNQS